MNILFVNSVGCSVWGGVESWMLRISNYLRDRGHKVTVAGRAGGAFLSRFAEENYRTTELRGKWDISPGSIFRVLSHIDENSVDIVVANTNRDLRISGVAARLSKRKPVVVNRRGLPAFRRKLRHRLSAKLAHHFLVPSNSLKKSLLEFGWIDEERVKVIPNFIDVAEIKRQSLEPLGFAPPENRDLIIGAVANLVGQKGLHHFLEAIALMKAAKKKVCAYIIGDGPLMNQLRRMANELDIEDSVIFTGFLKNPFPLVRRFLTIVLPSLFEPFGQVLIEAAALGVPAVASNVDGIPEVVIDGKTGILIPPGEPEAIEKAVLKIAENTELRRRLSDEALKRAMDFDISQIAPRVEEFFRNAIERHRKR